MIGATKLASHFGDKMFDEDTAKIVRRHAFWGALIMMIPAPGFDLVVFCIILWHMYSKLCQRANTKLTFGNVAIGIIVNIVIAFVVDLGLTLVPIIGWLGTGFIIYLQFYLSGKSYIETLKKLY